MEFDVLNIVLYCAVILLATKVFGLLAGKCGLPQVAGMIVAGILIGPAIFSQLNLGFQGLLHPTDAEMDVLHSFSEIGVVFILFSSGLETDLKELKKSGAAATVTAALGVLVPIALGTVVGLLFMGGLSQAIQQDKLFNALFIGCILSATSVGITVETLRELGKLSTRAGTTILSAAIIDDVMGIVALSLLTGISGGGNLLLTLLKAVGFFVFTVGLGLPLRKFFIMMMHRYPNKRRTSIFSLVMCFLYAYCAEKFFGIAAITGAYMAGLMLSGMEETPVVDRKVVVSGYMIFTPMFFAYIGISADFSGFTMAGLAFALVFVAAGIIGKIVGCGLAVKAFGYSNHDALSVGCGMIARGEVALAVYTSGKGMICAGGIDPMVATILLIILPSVLCPVLLKLTFGGRSMPHHPASTILSRSTISVDAIERPDRQDGASN